MKLLMPFLSIAMILLFSAKAIASESYKSAIRSDRESLFYNVCMDVLGNETSRADTLCYRYSEDISGENFPEIVRSMQKAFNNISRRNPKSVPFKVVINPKKIKSAFKKIALENDRSGDYQDEFLKDSSITKAAPSVVIPDRPVIDSKGKDLMVTDVEESNSSDDDSNEETKNSIVVSTVVDTEPAKEIISKEDLYEGANRVLIKRLCMAMTTIEEKEKKCNTVANENKNLSVSDTLIFFDEEYKFDKKIEEKVLKDSLIQVGERIVVVDNFIAPKDYEEYVKNGGPKSKERKTADVKVDEPIASPDQSLKPDTPDVVVASTTPEVNKTVENLIISEYEDILKSEIEKNCPTSERQCVLGVTDDVYKLRDEAIRKSVSPDDSDSSVVAPKIVDETSVSEEIKAVDSGATTLGQNEVNCNDDIQKRIKELLGKDENNILGKQFQLTSLKMALQIMEGREGEKLDNVEDFINRKQKNLIDSDNEKLTSKLVDFYRENGKLDDSSFITDTFNEVKKSNYFRSSTRIYNKSSSVLILADILSNKDSRFSELDAASAWFASEVNKKFKVGSYNGNLTNLSSLTYRVLGNLKNEKPPINLVKLKSSIDDIEKDLSGYYEIMREDIASKFEKCFQGDFAQCNSVDAFKVNSAKALMNLTNEIKLNENFNIEIESKLKGNIGGSFKFDFLPGQYK